ncbi:YtnP family quorum-quenching lactonase [Bacillus swezeyi]|uniref:MBL fold metallo-hydrolase n=1 Tax=Bacillus swezeyi TaxID=1925020 RepID=A0A5M8RNL3_9BACI|nr:MBL fold metallo-hydrolase [Bacillus swezeyi]KAA6448556.1 MBL fold metallo-hydrolase [Bacillus swezeyi]KAA6481672.1 MBL fold metallo-hydrolase [Bacillus swezeyi]TYS34867.1 MBL fold metallo-hydrolase [Bacillus swezeyi]
METLNIGDIKLTWLNGGVTHMDGGAMFGVVPKPLWSKKYHVNDKNQIELRTDPILVQKDGAHLLIDSGIGRGKMTDKQKRNYGVTEESSIDDSLTSLGLSAADIDAVLMTHLHFDHACGLTRYEGDHLVSVFPNASIYTSSIEWAEMKNPNIRSKNTYWKENWEAVQHQVKTFEQKLEVMDGITMHHTGGHSDGHSVIELEDSGETALHMADIMPTHAHRNPLWVLAYDDYPMTSITAKQTWQQKAAEKNAWYIFYHDAVYRALKWDGNGDMTESVKRERR